MKYLFALLVGAGLVFPISLSQSVVLVCHADIIEPQLQSYFVEGPVQPPPPPKQKTSRDIAKEKAEEYGVSLDLINHIVNCESRWKTDAVGDNGNSHGLVQIHRPSHPTISIEQANDPEFALDFLAKNLKAGKGRMWSCYPRSSSS